MLKTKTETIETYDTIFVGTPNWWSTIAPPIATFLEENNLSGKTVIPFCTHGGGGAGRIEQDITKLCMHSTVMSGFSVYGSGDRNTETQVSAWLQNMSILEN